MHGNSTLAPLISPAPTAVVTNRGQKDPAWPGIVLAFSATCIALGSMWDISWHESVGRDSFWTAAHLLIYLGGALGGCAGGWLAFKHTFLATADERARSVQIWGARAPLGAWVAIWGALAMITSAPFDNWWHNAYGLDVKIISPPHALLGMGMFGIALGALITVLARQNRLGDGRGAGLFIYVGGIFLLLGAVFVMEYVFPNMQHNPAFFTVCAMAFPLRLVTMARSARTSWPATKVALVYMGIACFMTWLLPLFPAQPRLAPIFNPVTHMVPPPLPLLLVFPALGLDLILRRTGSFRGWKTVAVAVLLAAVFLAILIPVQWYFSEFLLSPASRNWFFAGNRVWPYNDKMGEWTTRFWDGVHHLRWQVLLVCLGWATLTSWLGLLMGGWMRRVQR